MEIKKFLSPLLKWWWLIVISAILAGVSSYLAVRNEPDIFRARTTLMIGRPFDNPNPEGSQFYLSQQLAGTYADIARREPVRQATEAALGLDFLPNYQVNVPPQTQLIEIMVDDTNPSLAQAVANEMAHQLVQLSPGAEDPERQELAAFVDRQLAELAGQIEVTQEEISSLQAQLGEISSAREIAETQQQIAALRDKLSSLQTNYTGFLANSQKEAINVLTIVEPASLPRTPIGPNKGVTLILSMALGVMLASGAAYVLEYTNDSLRSEEDIRQAVGLPLLAALVKNNVTSEDHSLLTLKSPRSPLSEAFRELRTRVLFLGLNKPLGTLLVTSANPGEGKSYTSANLAIVMAQAGYRTILLDADLRRPSQHEIFDLRNDRGLSNLILEANVPDRRRKETVQKPLDELLDSVIQDTLQGGLYVMTSGSIPPNPSELVGSNGMVAVLEALAQRFDFIILDSAPSLAVTDTLLLASLADTVVVVSSATRSRSKMLKKVVNRLQEVNANVVGVVLNHAPKTEGGYYSYYHTHVEEDVELADARSDGPGRSANGFRKRFRRLVTDDGADQGHVGAEQP